MSQGIIAHIWSTGDSATGTETVETNINTRLAAFSDEQHRSAVRQQLEDCFTAIWQKRAKVLFHDEFGTD